MPLDPLGTASNLLALYQVVEKLIKDKAALNQALESIKSSVYEIFPNDVDFVLRLLSENQAVAVELTSTRMNKREHLVKLFRDAYVEAPGLSWSSYQEDLVGQFVTAVSAILLGYRINEVQSAADYLDGRAQERHQTAFNSQELLHNLKLDVEQLRSDLGRDQQSRQEAQVSNGSLKVRRLPASTSSFTGRSEALAELSKRLHGDVQVVYGLGGIGKTQLAVKFALTQEANYDVIWRIRSGNSSSIATDLGELAVTLKLAVNEDRTDIKLSRLQSWFSANLRWLLIFDDLQDLAELHKALTLEPTFQGKILITSRNSNWGNSVQSVRLDTWVEEESVQFLKIRLRSDKYDEEDELKKLGHLLGNLPLALEQAAAYINATPTNVQSYSLLFLERREELWRDKRHETHPNDYPYTVATTWTISIEKVQEDSSGALLLLQVCSFLAPDDIPLSLLTWGKEVFPEPLTTVLGDSLSRNQTLAALGDYSLLSWQDDFLSIHQLVQAVVRDSITEPIPLLEAVLELQLAGFPFDLRNPETWAVSDLLTPHLLTSSRLALESDADKMLTTEVIYEVARLLSFKGSNYGAKEIYSAADALLNEAIAVRRQHFGEKHGSVSMLLKFLADVRKDRSRKQFAESAPSLEKLEENSLETLMSLLKMLNDADTALEEIIASYEEAREIDAETYGENSLQYAFGINRMGAAYVDMAVFSVKENLLERAELLQRRALKIAENAVEHEKFSENELIAYLHGLARTLLASGKASEARRHLERCLEIAERFIHPLSSELATIYEYLGYALISDRTGKWAAVKQFRKAREIAKVLGMEERFVKNTFNLATSLAICGREFEAELCQRQTAELVSEDQLMHHIIRFAHLTKGLPPSDFQKAMREALKEIIEVRSKEA